MVRRVVDEVWSQGTLAAADELYAADFVSHQHSHVAAPQDVRGLAAVKTFVREFRQALPDFYGLEPQGRETASRRMVARVGSDGDRRTRRAGRAPSTPG